MMGLLQKAYETYENHARYAGKSTPEMKEPLAPVSHIITSAQIEITIDRNGRFISASTVEKDAPKIIIPVTEESAGRTSGICPHPLCDQVGYISPENEKKYAAYTEQLEDWALSAYTHPMLMPILEYVKGKTIMNDLKRAGIEKINEKDTIRWVVIGTENEDIECWKNMSLFRSFIDYYAEKKKEDEQVLCMVTGESTAVAKQHMKGIISFNGNAKLISANDTSNFTYRGRFKTDDQAVTIGYEASQKAHNALKWMASNQGVMIGGRTFLCWNPQGKKIPLCTNPLRARGEKSVITFAQYKEDLVKVLNSYKNNFQPSDRAVIASFDAATTGRLAVTYYNEVIVSDFLDRLEKWDLTCAWKHYNFGIESPSLDRIISCAFGTERSGRIEADDKVMRQHIQRLLACRVDGAKIPYDIVQAISQKTMKPTSYDKSLDYLYFTACAVIRKYYIDYRQEEYDMALERDKKDISYQYGRLLAVLEKIERDTYEKNESREPNAIRMQSMFCTRPAQIAANLIEQLKKSYYSKHKVSSRIFYDNLIGEIYDEISKFPENQLNNKLKETYILGYYLQRNELYSKKDKNDTEEIENDEITE